MHRKVAFGYFLVLAAVLVVVALRVREPVAVRRVLADLEAARAAHVAD